MADQKSKHSIFKMAYGETMMKLGNRTTLRKSADVHLTTKDLIHPHESSNLPGYCGYTPQLKFNCGHTYGYHTDKLTTKHTKNEKLSFNNNTLEQPSNKNGDSGFRRYTFIPPDGGDRKYVEKMVPGYTGFVPQLSFKYGRTYKEGTEEAIEKFKDSEYKRRVNLEELSNTVNSQPKLTVREDYPPADPSHPGVNVRYVAAIGSNKYDEKRDFTEAPIPGYQGYVPRQEEYKLGGRYGVWTRHAYSDALQTMMDGQRRKTEIINVNDFKPTKHSHTSTWPLPDTGNKRFGSIYNKRLGMVPCYTGYVPQRRFDFGETYGDSTRQLPACYDTPGYSTGKYNHPGPPMERTVIPVRI